MNGKITEDWVKMQGAEHLGGVLILTANFITEREAPRHVHQE